MNSFKKNRPKVGPLIDSKNTMVSGESEMVELMASSLSTVFTNRDPPNQFPHQSSDSRFGGFVINTATVMKAIKSMGNSQSSGPDELHPHFIRLCCKELCYPLTLLFQESYITGTIPNIWKKSNIIPIYKKGPKKDPLNYRPISLTSVLSKMMERIVVNQLMEYLETNHILSEDQFGLRKGRSVEDQLLLTYEYVLRHLDNSCHVDLILLDFQKAFDTVNHTVLSQKLFALGIRGPALIWLTNFLDGRSSRVSIGGSLSRPYPNTSGVPQGSVVGPILFLLLINDIFGPQDVQKKLFADDVKLYHAFSECPTSDNVLQDSLTWLNDKAISCGLRLNPDKCQVIHFCYKRNCTPCSYYIDEHILSTVTETNDLGVLVDRSLHFTKHVRKISNKTKGFSCNVLRRTVNRQPNFMMKTFTTYIRPLIEHSTILWNTNYVTNTRKLESIQRRWSSNIQGLKDISYAERLQSLDAYSIKGRLLRYDLIKMWKILHSESPIPPYLILTKTLNPNTRGHPLKLYVEYVRLDARKRSFPHRTIPIWNSLPENIACCTNLETFKKRLHTHMHHLLIQYED